MIKLNRIIQCTRFNFNILIIIISFLTIRNVFAMPHSCYPFLWDNNIHFRDLDIKSKEVIELHRFAKKALKAPIHSLKTLHSAGVINSTDPQLLLTRQAFMDSDYAVVTALMYMINQNENYFQKTREILLTWATVNEPTGNPIDESRLEGMIWAYDLIACDLDKTDKHIIKNWFTKMLAAKRKWKFHEITVNNNHHIHQLKILLLLDKVLQREKDWNLDLQNAKKYSTINLNPLSGESIDYKQRHALYYHNYVLKSWLEINLITNCCTSVINKSFNFLVDRILSRNIGHEFENSSAQIDNLREKNGFDYVKSGGDFDITRAAGTIVSYYSNNVIPEEKKLLNIVSQTKPSPMLAFLKVRKLLWKSNSGNHRHAYVYTH